MTGVMVNSETDSTVEPLRIGLVGTGNAAPHFARALAGSRFARVVDERFDSFDDMLGADLHGVIVATPTSEHVAQAEAAIARGVAVFCQRPLGRNAVETRRVIDAARSADVLLGVDMTFRAADAMRILHSTVQAGELGDIYAVDAVYHCAGGAENPWASNPSLAGGGVVLDAGISMIDLTLWTLGFPRVTAVDSRLFARGERIAPGDASVAEDYATASLDLDTGVTVNLSCGWHMSAGQNARVELTFYGTGSAGTFRNVDGSMNAFTSELFHGPHRHTLASGVDDWAGRTAVSWASMLARGGRFDRWVEGVADVAAAADQVLGRV